jgi:hypothetical protein
MFTYPLVSSSYRDWDRRKARHRNQAHLPLTRCRTSCYHRQPGIACGTPPGRLPLVLAGVSRFAVGSCRKHRRICGQAFDIGPPT